MNNIETEYVYNKNDKNVTVKRKYVNKTKDTARTKSDRETIKEWLKENKDRIMSLNKTHRVNIVIKMINEELQKKISYNTVKKYLTELN